MADSTSERISYPDQIWFDASNPGPLHDALRIDYARTKAATERRPSLRRHMAGCSICQAITAATAGAPAPSAGRKRIKLVITPEIMHRILNLPANFEIVHMFSADDPNTVSVLVAGEGLPETGWMAETPIVHPGDVAQGTANTAS
jgi:hypothetical protein